MLSEYSQSALKRAKYHIMEDGRYYGEIPEIPGVWGEGDNLEVCREELREVMEEWMVLSLKRGDPLPTLDQIDLNRIGAHAKTD